MKTLFDKNKEAIAIIQLLKDKETRSNISFDVCGSEMQYDDYNVVLMSNPPRKLLKCLSCGYSGHMWVV